MATIESDIKLKELYELDYHLWLEEMIKLLKNNQLEKIDLDNLIEELENLSRRDKAKVASLLEQIIIHLLLLAYWEEEYQRNKNHWQVEILTFRSQLNRLLTTNLINFLENDLTKIYQSATKITAKKMDCNLNIFPLECPYTLKQILNEDYLL